MLQKDKVILMTKLAIYDKKYGSQDRKKRRYFKWDYVYFKNFRTRVGVLFGCLILCLFYVLNKVVVQQADILALDIKQLAAQCGFFVLAVMGVYTLIGSMVAKKEYAESKDRLDKYMKTLDILDGVADEEALSLSDEAGETAARKPFSVNFKGLPGLSALKGAVKPAKNDYDDDARIEREVFAPKQEAPRAPEKAAQPVKAADMLKQRSAAEHPAPKKPAPAKAPAQSAAKAITNLAAKSADMQTMKPPAKPLAKPPAKPLAKPSAPQSEKPKAPARQQQSTPANVFAGKPTGMQPKAPQSAQSQKPQKNTMEYEVEIVRPPAPKKTGQSAGNMSQSRNDMSIEIVPFDEIGKSYEQPGEGTFNRTPSKKSQETRSKQNKANQAKSNRTKQRSQGPQGKGAQPANRSGKKSNTKNMEYDEKSIDLLMKLKGVGEDE